MRVIPLLQKQGRQLIEIGKRGLRRCIFTMIVEGEYTMQQRIIFFGLLNSAGDSISLFTSWEPGCHGQFYFLTTTALADHASEWLDRTMNTLLNIYGLQKCVRAFGDILADISREETKVRPNSFILDYVSTLHICENLDKERG